MLILLSLISYLLSLIFYLLSYFIIDGFYIQKNNQWREQFYVHILKVPPTFLLQESSARWHSWPNNMAEYGNGEAFDTEQFINVQESERYGIHVSGTKNFVNSLNCDLTL